MAQKAAKPAPLATGAGFKVGISSTARSDLTDTRTALELQALFLSSRFRLDADRARLTAELAFGSGGRA